MNAGFRWEEVRDRDHLEDFGVGRRIILKCYKNEMGGRLLN